MTLTLRLSLAPLTSEVQRFALTWGLACWLGCVIDVVVENYEIPILSLGNRHVLSALG